MRDFFAGLRRVLAYTDLERMHLGSMVHEFIRGEVIPRLRKSLAAAKTDTEKDLFMRLIEEYETYSNPSKTESKIYDKTAANIIRTLAQRSNMGDEAMEDLSMQIAQDFLEDRGDVNYLHTGLVRFFAKSETQGPLELNKLWMSIVDMRTRWRIRIEKRHHQEKPFDYRQNDEGEELDPVSQVPAPSEVDESYVRQVMKDLVSFMHRSMKRPEFRDMFDRWMEMAQEKGAAKVDMKHDVFPYLRDKGWDVTNPAMSSWWLEVKRYIVKFFEQELEGEVSDQVKKMLRISAVEVLTYETFRRRLAAWILAGIR
jgi:hypothetical protein